MSEPGDPLGWDASAEPDGGADPLEEWERRQTDTEIYQVLRQAGFSGVLWRQLAEELARYGCGVLEAWLVSGVIGAKVAKEGHGGVSMPWQLRGSDFEAVETRKELAGETAAAAMVLFRQKLSGGQWDPAGGRSLTSYFMGACLYCFPNVLRRWQRCEDRWSNAQTATSSEIGGRHATVHPEHDVDAMITLDELLSDSGEREIAIVRLCVDGYTSTEIAYVLGSTPGAVRGVLKRWRAKAQLKLIDDEGAGDESTC
ncbi:hypothetical protein ACFWMR_23980 [Amycolatopsis thailandensis]|uniref:hypothetical protein n=1 Tax=Amycolatopsis thailandensis TaxID=589330 RepID=UPI00364D2AC5